MEESSKSVAWAFVKNHRNADAINILCNQANMKLPEAYAQIKAWKLEIKEQDKQDLNPMALAQACANEIKLSLVMDEGGIVSEYLSDIATIMTENDLVISMKCLADVLETKGS